MQHIGFWFLVGGWSAMWYILGFDFRGRLDKRKKNQ